MLWNLVKESLDPSPEVSRLPPPSSQGGLPQVLHNAMEGYEALKCSGAPSAPPVQDKQLPPHPHYGKELHDEEQKYYDSSETSSPQDSDTDDESSPLADILAAFAKLSCGAPPQAPPRTPSCCPRSWDKNVPLRLLPASSSPYPYMLCFAKGCSPGQGKGTALPAFSCTL